MYGSQKKRPCSYWLCRVLPLNLSAKNSPSTWYFCGTGNSRHFSTSFAGIPVSTPFRTGQFGASNCPICVDTGVRVCPDDLRRCNSPCAVPVSASLSVDSARTDAANGAAPSVHRGRNRTAVAIEWQEYSAIRFGARCLRGDYWRQLCEPESLLWF
jgi:hypothetical protein